MSDVVEGTAREVADDAKSPDAVLIIKKVDDDGNISVEVSQIGDVRPTEIATLIELGRAAWSAKIGV